MYGIEDENESKLDSLQWKLRELTNLELRNLVKETISRVRQLRFFNAVRDLLKNGTDKDIAVLSCCGHHGSIEDVKRAAMLGQCVEKIVRTRDTITLSWDLVSRCRWTLSNRSVRLQTDYAREFFDQEMSCS